MVTSLMVLTDVYQNYDYRFQGVQDRWSMYHIFLSQTCGRVEALSSLAAQTVKYYTPYNPLYNPSFHFIFHFLFHLILHYRALNPTLLGTIVESELAILEQLRLLQDLLVLFVSLAYKAKVSTR